VRGWIEGIFVSPVATVLPSPVEAVHAEAGRGLVGDRYFGGTGTYSDHPDPTGRDLTLVEADALDRAGIGGAESRRNVVVAGLQLGELLGKRFRVGAVECYGRRLCEPCAHLQSLTHPGVLRALAHTGLRADVLTSGEIRVGDEVYSIDSGVSSEIEPSTTSASASAASSGG
jgi:MOSC domain